MEIIRQREGHERTRMIYITDAETTENRRSAPSSPRPHEPGVGGEKATSEETNQSAELVEEQEVYDNDNSSNQSS